jgi:glycerol-3-phosphate O-acyltransferase
MLTLRHLVRERDGLFEVDPDEHMVLRYYANSIAHLLERLPLPAVVEAAPPAQAALTAA